MKLKIFVASPSDVSEERETVSFVVQEIKRTIGDIRNVELETVKWETHSFPDVGDDAQDVINRQIGKYDVLVGIMWKRFGTPTKRSDSGTGEEFERAYEYFKKFKRPKIMFYFRKTPFYPSNEDEVSQIKKVLRFRKKLEKLGVLFWEYQQPLDFERDLREHLIRQVLELTAEPKEKVDGAPVIFMSCAREDSARVETVYKVLKTAGFRSWLDVQDLIPGQRWEDVIEQTIQKADFILIFVSKESVSKIGYIQKEWRFAIEQMELRNAMHPEKSEQSNIILVRLDAVEPPKQLIKYQWVDLFSPQGIDKLIFALRAAWKAKESK
jgi:hypothetical protein